MAETDPRASAKIYDLSAFRRSRAASTPAPAAKPAPVPSYGGGAWYHEAAIREDERPRRT